MNNSNDHTQAMLYVGDKPNIMALKTAYDQTLNDLGWYMTTCRDSFDYRRNIWAGKAKDLLKHGADAFPWEDASDTEVFLIEEHIDAYVSLFMSSLGRANIRAFPVEMGDVGRAKVVSAFLKWMIRTYIPDFARQMEMGANYLLEKNVMITYVGWQKEARTFLQKLDINQIAEISPPLARLVLSGENDEQLIMLFKQQFHGIKDKRIKKALIQLRKDGVAELPVVRQSINAPKVAALAPDGDVFFPAYTTNPQEAPYCFWRVIMTAQQLWNKVETEGWDEEWVEQVLKGPTASVELGEPRTSSTRSRTVNTSSNELFEVIYCYQRLIDDDDGSQGIYCTVFHPHFTGKVGEPAYAKRELLNGYDDYPFVVTRLSEDNKRLYECNTLPEKMRGAQWQVKVERDSRIDRNSLATCPPRMVPDNFKGSLDWSPKSLIPYRRMGEIHFAPVPQFNPGSVEIERTIIDECRRMMGRDPETDGLANVKQQAFVSKFLNHVQEVIRYAFQCFQRFGPEEVFFRVTGVSDSVKFSRGDPNEKFDITIMFDVLNNDPETVEKQIQQMVTLKQIDTEGRMKMGDVLEFVAYTINPAMADAVLQPAQQAQENVVKKVTDDLAKIYAGIEVGAQPNGAQIALQVVQQYLQQPDVMQRAQQDEAFKARLEKYVEQYQFQMTQMQNAQIGKIGTKPAQMAEMQTQQLNQAQ